ncbi:MAG: hypothetical protein ABIH46_03895 [Chloroflexota bacterium]
MPTGLDSRPAPCYHLAAFTAEQERTAARLKEQLSPIGIDIKVKLHDQGPMFDLLRKRNFDTAVSSGSAAYDDPDQAFGQQLFTGVPCNFSESSDEKIEKGYEGQARALDPAKREKVVLDMLQRLQELIPCSTIRWSVNENGFWKELL